MKQHFHVLPWFQDGILRSDGFGKAVPGQLGGRAVSSKGHRMLKIVSIKPRADGASVMSWIPIR